MAEDKISNLYNAFVNSGYSMEPENEFRENLKDPKKRRAAYEALVSDGYDMEPYAAFESNIGYAPKPQAEATPAPQSQQQTTSTAPDSATPVPSPQAEQVSAQPAHQGWKPTEQEKIRMSISMRSMLDDFNQKSKTRLEQTRRMTELMTPEGRRRLEAAKFQALLAGTPTQVSGLTPPTPVSASQDATQDGDGGTQQQPVQSGQSPVPYGVKYVDGKPVTEWLLPDGSLTTSLIEADQAEYSARTVRLRHQFENRMKQNGLDPAKQEDVQKQAQLDYEAPMRKVLNQVWAQAEAEDRAADEEYNRQLKESKKSARGNIRAYGPDGMPLPTAQETLQDFNRAVKRKETFNLETMAETMLQKLPSSYREQSLQVYEQYFNEHNNELKGRSVEQAAEDALRSEIYNAVYQRAVESKTPKSKKEFLLRKLTDQPFISPYQAMDMAAAAMTNSWGMNAAELDAMSKYGQQHRALDIIGTIGNMAVDPTTYFSSGIGSAVGKRSMQYAGQQMIKNATKNVAERFAARTLTGRVVGGVAGGAANFATFEALKSVQGQMAVGGVINPETGEREFSFDEVLKAGAHGLILGGVTGPLSPLVGNVADKAVKATSSTAGKFAVRGGEVAVSTLAEGTIFSVPQWINGEGAAFDVWTDNMAMMLGFKAQHGIKSAPRIISSMRPVKPVDGRPLTQAERNHNRMDFEERLRRNLDASPSDLSFSAEELEELRRAGYGELSDLFSADAERRADNSKDRVQKTQEPAMNPAEGAIELRAERVEAETIHNNPEFDGYSAMEELMQDGRVSQATRAKAYYVLTGRMLPMSTVTGYTSIKGEDGSVIINSMSADGEVVTSRKFANEKSAQQEIDNIMRQAELNSVDVGERYAEAIADDMVLNTAVNEVSPGADPETVKRIYRAVKAGNKDVTAEQVQLAEYIDDAIARNKDIADAHRPEAIREAIKEELGIDVDAVLRKSPAKRTEAEQEAVKTYLERLFPEETRKKAEEPTPAQAEAQSQYEQGRALYGRYEEGDATAQADVDAIALRMEEAYEVVEEAFGTEAEYYMFHLNENPWGLLNDPELTVEQQDAVLYYINAKAALDGVMDASNEAAERKRQEVQQDVEKRTHKDNGVIIPATMKVDDRQVYVVKGDVVMFPDQSGVDTRNSSESIVVMDAQSGKYEFTSPDQILKVSDVIAPQEELEAAMSVIEQEQMAMFSELADEIDISQATNTMGAETETDTLEYLSDDVGKKNPGNEEKSVNLQNDNKQYGLSERISQADDGADAGEATTLQRAFQSVVAPGEGDVGGESVPGGEGALGGGESDVSRQKIEVERAEKFARDNGLWIPMERVFSLGRPGPSGNEADTYILGSDIFKVNNLMNSGGNISSLLEKVMLHNEVFPNTPYELVGFTGFSGRSAYPIVKQGYIDGAVNATPREIADYMTALGFEQIGDYEWRNGSYDVSDMRPRNVLKDSDGDIYVIDAEIRKRETALSRIPVDEQGEPMFEAVDKDTAWDGLVEAVGAEADAADIAMAQVQQATADLETLKRKPPTPRAPKLKGSPMAMAQAKREAAEKYQSDLAEYNQQVADTQARLDAWNGIVGVYTSRNAELRRQQEDARRQRDAEAHDAAVAQFEDQQRIKAEKQAEAERLGTHNVSAKIKEKWDNAPKIEGNPDALTLPDGSSIRGRYVLTEAGAASASHDVNNAYEPTEGFPIDENGQSVNDRDYLRDMDAQRIVEQMAGAYDNRALQTPVIVSQDGVVLSGNNRTMSGDLAARQGTDKAYVDYLREFGQKYGFTPEQVAGMNNPRLVFVPDEALPYDATSFSRFNAQEMKSQSKPEAAVKLGKIVPGNVFNNIVSDISRYDRLADYYADEKAVTHALGALMQAGVINDKQMPEMRTGTALSAAGKELIENTLIGKVFQTSPDAVRQIISMPTLRQSIVMGLNEIANNRTLAHNGYDLSEELSKAVDLVTRAKAAMPDVYTDGMPVSPFGRMQGLFDDEYGDSRVTDATTLLLADLLNSGKPSDLRKVLATYNNEASQSASGQADIFTGEVPTKENILTDVNENFRNATPREQQALVDAAIAERKRRAEAEQRGRDQEREQIENAIERSAELSEPNAGGIDTQLEPLSKDPNDPNEDSPEEAALRARIGVGEEWEEEGTTPDKPIYKRKLYIDGQHEVIQVDEPNNNGDYIGSYFEYHGERFGNLSEVIGNIDEKKKLADDIAVAEADVNVNPTDGQKEAGNYKKGHVQVGAFDVTIEQPVGSVRRGTDADGKSWETEMHNTYGYIRGTEGVDGDHIDVFLSTDIDGWNGRKVFVVDQTNSDGSFDEHKVMLGFNDKDKAMNAYLANYDRAWTDEHPGLRISETSLDNFSKWIHSSHRKTKPFADYKNISSDVSPLRSDHNTRVEELGSEGKVEASEARLHSGIDSGGEIYREVYNAAKGLVESSGIEVIEASDADVSAMLEQKNTPIEDQPNRANEKLTSGSVLQRAMGDSSSNALDSVEVIAKVQNTTQSTKNNIKKFNNGDFMSGKMDLSTIDKAFSALGRLFAMRNRGGSRYTVLQTDGGKTVAIRLSDHGANGNNFRKDGAERNLSIVIERRKYETPDSEIEFTEATIQEATFLERPLDVVKAIVKGIEDVLGDGDFTLDPMLGTVEKKDGSAIRFLKNREGMVYGWTDGKRVYLNRGTMNPETPIHEYTHLWDEMVRRENPELWQRGVELMKQTPLWEEVLNDPNYADIQDNEDAMASEVHSRLTGKHGAEVLKDMIAKSRSEGPLAVAERVTLVERIKGWLRDMYNALKGTLEKWSKHELEHLTEDNFVKMTLRDLADGLNPNTEIRRGEQLRIVTKENPMLDDYHRGVRKRDDVMTFDEVLAEAESNWDEYGDLTYPDMDIEQLRAAKESGRIIVYSSKPIEAGVFVTPSRMNAEDYAGGEKVYEKEVSINDVAWTGEDEGQYAPVAENIEDDVLLHAAMSRNRNEFDKIRDRAVSERGLVMLGLNDSEVKIVNVPLHDFTGTGKQAIEKARIWSQRNLIGKHFYHRDSEDGFSYTINENTIDKYLSSSSTKGSDNLGVHLAVLKKLPEIIDNSVEAEIHPDYVKKNGKRKAENGIANSDVLVHRFYGASDIGGVVYRVKTTIKESRGNGISPYDYQVTGLELLISGSESSDALSNSNLISVANLLNGVEKSYDSGIKLLDMSNKYSNSYKTEDEELGNDSYDMQEGKIRYHRKPRRNISAHPSLFDTGDFKAMVKVNVDEETAWPMQAEAANKAIDAYAEIYMHYLTESEWIESEMAKCKEGSDEYAELQDRLSHAEVLVLDGHRELEDALREFYAHENTPEDAERIARQMVNRTEAEVAVTQNRTALLHDILNEAQDSEMLISEPAQEGEMIIKTAGGVMSYKSVGHLPDGKRGEFAYVERKFSRSGEFDFTGGDRIESRADVAYMFRSLCDYSIEHVFGALVKDGDIKVIHIGMGGPTASFANLGALRAAYDSFGADKVYLVHNHPSGNLQASKPDENLLERLYSGFEETDVDIEGLIIDTTSGRYMSFGGDAGVVVEQLPSGVNSQERPVDVLRFDRQAYDERLESSPKLASSEMVVDFINAHRRGEGGASYLVLANDLRVVGNFHTGLEGIDGLADELVSAGLKYGGSRIILYGSDGLSNSDIRRVADDVKKKSMDSVSLMDVITITGQTWGSAVDEGLIGETEATYGKTRTVDGEDTAVRFRDGESDGERLRAIRALEPIEVKPNNMSRAELREVYENLPTVDMDGREIEFYRSAFNKNYRKGGLFGQVVPVLDAVLENSVLAYSEADNLGGMVRPDGSVHKAHPNVDSYDNYVGKISLNGKDYYVRLTVQNTKDSTTGVRSCFVSNVDLYEKTASEETDTTIFDRPNQTESGKQSTNNLSLPITTRARVTADGIVDAKLQQFFERASSEALELDKKDRVNELSEKLGIPVKIITDKEDIDNLPSARHRRAKGWWSSDDNGVVVVMPNNVNVADVDNTVVHEVVGHKGLRALIGAERFDDFLGEIYSHASNPIRKVIDKMTDDMVSAEADRLRVRKSVAHERAGEDVNTHYFTDMAEARLEAEQKREQFRKEATEEYMSDLGGRIGSEGFEKMSRDELTLWGKIKAKVQQFLDKFLQGLKIAKSIRLTDKDLSYILYKSWKNLRDKQGKGGVFAEAEDIVRRQGTRFSQGKPHERMAVRKEAVSNRIEELFDKAVSGDLKGKPIEVGKLTERGRDFLKRLSGVELKKGISFVVNPSDLLHIYRRHFGENEKDIRNIPLMKEDIRNLHEILCNPDNVIYGEEKGGQQRTMFFFLKATENGSYNLMEVYADRKGNLTSKSFFKSKEGVSQRVMLLNESSTLTSVTDGATLLNGAKIPKFFEYPPLEGEEDVIRFRDPGMGLEETITRMKAEAMQANAGNLQAKREAMHAIGGNLNHLRQAMARQREYDITTAKSIKDLARIFMENGLLDNLGNAEVKSLLAQVTNSIGRQDISKQVNRVFEIMVNNHLRNTEAVFGKLISMRTSRADGRGINVQGALDPEGETILKVFNSWKGLNVDEIDRRIVDAIDAMSDSYTPIAERATLEYAGLQIAREYAENVTNSKQSEKTLREEIKKAKEEKDAGRMTADAYCQFEDATRATIHQMKLDRIAAYESLMEKLGGELRESVERAKAWREAEKQRVEEIHHLANSDMEGRELRGDREDTRLMKLRNHWLVNWLLEPMSTLDQMLKMFGSKNPNGEGYMQNHFMRGWIDAADKEQEMKESVHKQMDEKAAEIFGKHRVWYNGGSKKVYYTYSDIYDYAKGLPGATITYYDGAEMREYEIGQGELLYLYAVEKMPMGRATNRRMGIDDATIENITNTLDPKLKEYADWVQDMLLPQMGDIANEVHKRMFGADMDAIENYFPFVRDKDALKREIENGQTSQTNDRISVQTGAIKKRVASVSKWNMRQCNFMDVLAKHVDEMTHWTAFAELSRDFGTLLSYNRLKQQVFAMNSVYGAGEQLWKRFQECCAIATDAYEPQRAKFDRFMVQGAKGVTMGKISLRTFTALKQTLSLPAFFGEVNMKYVAADLGTGGVKACQWAWKNMPNFRKRILSRTSGDYRLKENEYDGKIMKASSYGMIPNIGVDAWTIAVGSHGVYKTRKAKYLRWGMDESQAEKRAVQDAELCYNKSQQSSEGPFMAPVQVDHTFYATSAMLFRNSSTSYAREAHTSARNLKRLISGEVNEEYVAKQILRTLHPETEEAWTDEQWAKARENAKKEIRSAYVKNTVNLAMFGWILPWLWRIGGVAPLLLLSGDDEEKQKQWADATRQSIFAPVEGLAYGDVIADGLNMMTGANKKSIYMLGRSNPIFSDILQAAKKADKDLMAAANDVINIIGGMAFGVNPQTVTDWTAAIIDYNSDAQTQKECALLVARLLSCPPSQLEKVYFDELDASAREASAMTPWEIAERYAEYKMYREAPLTGRLRSDEANDSIRTKYRNKVLKMSKERIDGRIATERTKELLTEYDEVNKREAEVKKLADTDREAYKAGRISLRNSVDMRKHRRVRIYKKDVSELTDRYHARDITPAERDSIVELMFRTRDKLLEDLDSAIDK